jgi:hypothetical protein
VASFEKANAFCPGVDGDLRNEASVVGLGKQRLDAVGLRADAIDQSDVFAVRIAVNVIASGKAIACGESGWE